MRVFVAGDQSDIAKGLVPFLEVEHEVHGWNRGKSFFATVWHVAIICLGKVAPVGPWAKGDWVDNFDSNVLLPVKIVQLLWDSRLANASVCFMAGSNPQRIMSGYAPYNASKMALLKVVEQLDYESPDAKFFALGPGYVNTKIHKPTLEAHWPNERIAKGNPTPIEKIYDCLKWCISQPKEVVGGRNICVSDPYGPELAERLKNNPNLYKLRRVE